MMERKTIDDWNVVGSAPIFIQLGILKGSAVHAANRR